MPTNLELKIKVDSHKELKKILRLLKAKRVDVLNQKDIYYKISEGLLKLRIENGAESLIFYNREEKKKNRWSDYSVLHFKDKNTEKFFEKLFEVETIVEKRRELYTVNNTRIHLDEVKNLGCFLELETLVTDGKKDAKKRFEEVKKWLNLNQSAEIRESYRDLILRNRKP